MRQEGKELEGKELVICSRYSQLRSEPGEKKRCRLFFEVDNVRNEQ